MGDIPSKNDSFEQDTEDEQIGFKDPSSVSSDDPIISEYTISAQASASVQHEKKHSLSPMKEFSASLRKCGKKLSSVLQQPVMSSESEESSRDVPVQKGETSSSGDYFSPDQAWEDCGEDYFSTEDLNITEVQLNVSKHQTSQHQANNKVDSSSSISDTSSKHENGWRNRYFSGCGTGDIISPSNKDAVGKCGESSSSTSEDRSEIEEEEGECTDEEFSEDTLDSDEHPRELDINFGTHIGDIDNCLLAMKDFKGDLKKEERLNPAGSSSTAKKGKRNLFSQPKVKCFSHFDILPVEFHFDILDKICEFQAVDDVLTIVEDVYHCAKELSPMPIHYGWDLLENFAFFYLNGIAMLSRPFMSPIYHLDRLACKKVEYLLTTHKNRDDSNTDL